MAILKKTAKFKAGQNANYLRSVEVTPSGSSNRTMVNNYAKHVENEKNPGSLLELRVAVEHYGQGVTIYHQKENGKCVRHCSIDPSSKKGGANIELVYVPPPDKHTVGHYDVLIKGKVVKVDSDSSNCLFQAFAYGQNPHLTSHEQKQQASKLRQTVAETIKTQPHLWNDHIAHRVEMNHLRKGTRFALTGAGPKKNETTKVYEKLYKEQWNGNDLHTMYVQVNEVACRAVRSYELIQPNSSIMRLACIEVHMDGLSIADNKGMRCWHTNPIAGMIKHHKGNREDTEVSFHLCPSHSGANAGEKFGNAVMASSHYNKLERAIWSDDVIKCIGDGNYSMTVKGKMGPIVPENKEKFFEEMDKAREFQEREKLSEGTKNNLSKRFELIQKNEPRAHHVEKLTFTLTIPKKNKRGSGCDVNSLVENIKKQAGLLVEAKNDRENIILEFAMRTDYDLFVPNDCTRLKNGELHTDEIKKATSKVPQEVQDDEPPMYRKDPGEPPEKCKEKFKALLSEIRKATSHQLPQEKVKVDEAPAHKEPHVLSREAQASLPRSELHNDRATSKVPKNEAQPQASHDSAKPRNASSKNPPGKRLKTTDKVEPSELFKKLTMPTGKITEDKVQPGADLVTSGHK